MARPLPSLLLLVGACALDNHTRHLDGGLDFTIGGIALRVSSGAARVSGGALGLYLTDQPDACLAITQAPVGRSTLFVLRVAPQLDGATAAMVVPQRITPGPGEAMGELVVQTGGVKSDGHDAAMGSVTWKTNDDGTTTILSLDVGFDGATERLTTGELTVPACR